MLGDGLPTVDTTSLAIDTSADPPPLRAGTYGRSTFELQAGPVPQLQAAATTIGGGDGDGILEPGESFTLTQRVNTGGGRDGDHGRSRSRSRPGAHRDDLRLPGHRRRRRAAERHRVRRDAVLRRELRRPVQMTLTRRRPGARDVPLSIPTGSPPMHRHGDAALPIPDNDPGAAMANLRDDRRDDPDLNVALNMTHLFTGDVIASSAPAEPRSCSEPPRELRRQLHRHGVRRRGGHRHRRRRRAVHRLVPAGDAAVGGRRPGRRGELDLEPRRPGAPGRGTLNNWLAHPREPGHLLAPAGRLPPPPRATSTATASATSRSARRARTAGAGAVHVLYGSATGLDTHGLAVLAQDSAGILTPPRRRRVRPVAGCGQLQRRRLQRPRDRRAGREPRRRHGARPLRQRERPDRDGEPAVDAGLDRDRRRPRARRPFGATLAAGNLNTYGGERTGDRRARRGHRGLDGRRHRAGPEGHLDRAHGHGLTDLEPVLSGHRRRSRGRRPLRLLARRRRSRRLGAGADLAIGVPEEDGATADYGVVQVLLGSATGLSATGSSLWSQDSPGIGDAPETGDRLRRLAGDRQRRRQRLRRPDRRAGRGHRRRPNAGVVHVLLGSAAGLTGTGSQLWSQDSAGIADSAEDGDGFGSSLAVGDFGGSASCDLASACRARTSARRRRRHRPDDPRRAAGPTGTGSQTFAQNSAGIDDAPEAGDEFGYAAGGRRLRRQRPSTSRSGRRARAARRALRRRPSHPRQRLRPHRDRQPAVVAELGRRRGHRRGERPLRRRARARAPPSPPA